MYISIVIVIPSCCAAAQGKNDPAVHVHVHPVRIPRVESVKEGRGSRFAAGSCMQFSIWIEILGSTLGILVLTCPGNSIGTGLYVCIYFQREESEALAGDVNRKVDRARTF